ncbi:MAG: von Willebrand factor type A domain-containing protein [Bacteroidetes bacterium]|nr:von Willebrand factor type A domain-containing protein [Bacteroidota bacterium]
MIQITHPYFQRIISALHILFFCCTFLSNNTLFAQPTTGILQGKITDAYTGEAIGGVNVILMQNGNIKTVQSTNASGKYMYDNMNPTTFDVMFSKKGGSLANNEIKNVQIEAGMITQLNITISDGEVIAEPIHIWADPVTNPYAYAIIIDVPKNSDEPKEEFKGQYYPFIPEQDFVLVNDKPNSTFSADVDQAFYTIVRRMIMHGITPPAGAVRIEEMLNYFDYDYPMPTNDDAFSVYSETAKCPWNTNHLLVHIGLQGREIINESLPPSNLVFLIDVSGSMGSSDKLPLVKQSFRTLVKQLRPKDKVSIVIYRDTASVLLENISGDDGVTIMKAIGKLQADGTTAGGAGLKMAYDVAKKYFIKDGNNRVIMATDGDFNVGFSSDADLLNFIEGKKKTGIYLTALGYGMDNLQDGKLEILADKGNGNYAYVSSANDAEKVLVTEMGATLYSIAKDVKIEATFNKQFAKAYRLIGYENRMLTDTEFDKNKTDAGDIGAGHTVTALYEVIPADEIINSDNKELLQLHIKYKEPKSAKQSVNKEIISSINYNNQAYTNASENFKWSAAVAEFGLIIRNSKFKSNADLSQVTQLAESAIGNERNGYRADFLVMLEQYKKMSGRK